MTSPAKQSHPAWPAWYDGKYVNEILFCEAFLSVHPMKCIGGRLFTVNGPVEDEELVKRQIIGQL